MQLEALLAEFRQCVPYSKAQPSMEALRYNGMLGQLWKGFIADGHANPLVDTRASLQAHGAPLAFPETCTSRDDRRAQARVAGHQSSRPHLAWVNHHLAGRSMSPASRSAACADLTAQWWRLSQEQKDAWLGRIRTHEPSIADLPAAIADDTADADAWGPHLAWVDHHMRGRSVSPDSRSAARTALVAEWQRLPQEQKDAFLGRATDPAGQAAHIASDADTGTADWTCCDGHRVTNPSVVLLCRTHAHMAHCLHSSHK